MNTAPVHSRYNMDIKVIEGNQQTLRCGWCIYEEIGVAIINVVGIDPYQKLLNQARTYLSKTYDVSWEEVCKIAEDYAINWFQEENPNL